MKPEVQANKQLILGLGVLTLVGFPLFGMLLVKLFSDHDITIMIRSSEPLMIQLGIGLAVGSAMGLAAHILTTRSFMRPSTNRYNRLFAALNLNWIDKILISVCAGFGEELFFRGAIQLFGGVILTAIVFVAIHGYLNLKDWRISLYGLMMTGFIIVLGILTESHGIWTAVVAHIMIDLILLFLMKDKPTLIPIESGQE